MAAIFIAFINYCLHVTLRRRLRDLAPGLTPRSVLEKSSAMQMIDVHLPTSDGHTIILSRYTQPDAELQLLFKQLKLELPDQPPTKIIASGRDQSALSEVPCEEFHLFARPSCLTGRLQSKGRLIVIVIPI